MSHQLHSPSVRGNDGTPEPVRRGVGRTPFVRSAPHESRCSPSAGESGSSAGCAGRAGLQRHSIVALRSRLDDALLNHLADVGYAVLLRSASSDLLPSVNDERPSIVLLNLPHHSEKAMAVCRQLKTCADVAVIRISSCAAYDSDCVFCLGHGADDYLRRPVSPREVEARIRSILRRTRLQAFPAMGLTIDSERYVATLDGQSLPLTPAEFRVLAALHEAHERVVTRAELMRAVNCYRIRSERAVDSLIKNLRHKLQAAIPGRTLVHATYGAGYHLSR